MWFIIFLVIAGIFAAQQIRIVPQQSCYMIERLGKFYTAWEAGLHFKVPVVDKIVRKISLKEQVYDFPPQDVITKDNVTMEIDSVVYASVFDPEKYTYGISDPTVGLQSLTATTLRSIIGSMELDQTLSSRTEINNRMQEVLDEATDEWGIQVSRVEVKNIKPPAEIEQVMTKQMRAERERRQTVLEAQAHKESVISRAEGDKQAKMLAAEAERDAQIALAQGRAEAIRVVYQAEAEGLEKLAAAGISDEIIRLKSVEAMKDVANGQATKIFVPNSLMDSIGAAGAIGESFRNFTGETKNPEAMKAMYIANAVENDVCLDNGSSKESVIAAAKNAEIEHDLHNPRRNTKPSGYSRTKPKISKIGD